MESLLEMQMVSKWVPKMTYLFLKALYAMYFTFECGKRTGCENRPRVLIPGAAVWIAGRRGGRGGRALWGPFLATAVVTRGSGFWAGREWLMFWAPPWNYWLALLSRFPGATQEALKMKKEVIGLGIHNESLPGRRSSSLKRDCLMYKVLILSVNSFFFSL